MLTLPHTRSMWCTEPAAEYWPCTFKYLWFHDMPFLLLPETEIKGTPVPAKRSHRTMSSFLKRSILYLMILRLYASIVVRMHRINEDVLRSVSSTRSNVSLRSKFRRTITSHRQERKAPASLLSMPAELRLRIFDYVTSGASMRVVGYRHGARDAVYFKERVACPIALTCKALHTEVMEAYFKNLFVSIKSASPSEFSGDMSSFGAAHFRGRLRRISVADGNELRRSRICAAFPNAQIEYSDKYASGARKGAYYFG